MKNLIENMTFDAERALYNLKDAEVRNCTFAGPADGESALKEARDITVSGCSFSLRYPLWHVKGFTLADSKMDELTRAAIWYSENGKIVNSVLGGLKVLRECKNITLEGVDSSSPEMGWRCCGINISKGKYDSQYFLFESKNINISNIEMKGKYSFQYTENVTVSDSVLDTKDAFWHAKNVTVRNCTVKGEYLGWYSDRLTLINCRIIGTQPLCYAKHLKLIDCTMEDTDLSFEYSDVTATVNGEIMSVKNPHSGKIIADGYGEVILENSVVKNSCRIIKR